MEPASSPARLKKDHRRNLVCIGQIADNELIVLIEHVEQRDMEVAREAVLPVGAVVLEDDGIGRIGEDVPDHLVQPEFTPVERIDPVVVLRSLEKLAVDLERGAADAVGHRTDAGAEIALARRVDIFRQGLVAGDDVGELAFPVRGEQRDDAGAVVGHLQGDVPAVKGIELHFPAGERVGEVLLRNERKPFLLAAGGQGQNGKNANEILFHAQRILPAVKIHIFFRNAKKRTGPWKSPLFC